MTDKNEQYVKILFRYFSTVLDQWMVETMWAVVVDGVKGHYRLDNIPFYGPLVASDDIVFAEYDEDEEFLTYRHTVNPSGNSIVSVVIMDDATDVETIRNMFRDMGCASEKINAVHFAMEVLFTTNYFPIMQKLNELRAKGILDFAEPCLSKLHLEQTKTFRK